MEEYFIFSDESGYWHNTKKDALYVRSWVKILADKYYKLEGIWKTQKLPYPTDKSLLKNQKGISEIIFNNSEIILFFTITKLNEFYRRKWKIRDQVSLALSQLESLLKRKYEKKIPPKLKNALNQVLFLNVYEAFHIDNAVKYLCDKNAKYNFIIHKPQFAENDYLEVFYEVIKEYGDNIKCAISKGEELGIKVADSLAKILRESVEEEDTKKAEFLKEMILNKSPVGERLGIKGLCKIFNYIPRSYGDLELQREENIFCEKLRKLFS